jgi:hypothetical protein
VTDPTTRSLNVTAEGITWSTTLADLLRDNEFEPLEVAALHALAKTGFGVVRIGGGAAPLIDISAN